MSLLNIVVIDSSDYYRKMIVKTLEESSFNVVGSAVDFKKIAEILGSNIANLFIIEMLMPDVSGIEMARFIADKKKNISIVMMSSIESDDFVVESVKIGIADYLKKPFKSEDLLSSMERVEKRMGGL